MHLYPIDGAVHRRGKDDTAWNARDATWSMVIAGIDPDPEHGAGPEEMGPRTTGRRCTRSTSAGAYPNFMMDDEGEERVQATYGDNYPRLAALKAKYDPANLFRVNQNIHPVT